MAIKQDVLGIEIKMERFYEPERPTQEGVTPSSTIVQTHVYNGSGRDIDFLNVEFSNSFKKFVSSPTPMIRNGNSIVNGGRHIFWEYLGTEKYGKIDSGATVAARISKTNDIGNGKLKISKIYGQFSNGQDFILDKHPQASKTGTSGSIKDKVIMTFLKTARIICAIPAVYGTTLIINRLTPGGPNSPISTWWAVGLVTAAGIVGTVASWKAIRRRKKRLSIKISAQPS